MQQRMRLIQHSLRLIAYIDEVVSRSKKIDVRDSILVAGSPRSGTTWLMEILKNIPGYTYLFEPLHAGWFPDSRKAGFRSRTYLSPEMNWPEGEDYLRRVFTGDVVSLLPPYEFKPRDIMNRLLNNKLVVKSVRLNRLLPWFVKRFQLRSIVFIIRHPCAVVVSQLKTGFCGYQTVYPPYADTFPTVDVVLDEASKIESVDHSLLSRLKKIKTREEVLAAVWCLDNYIPLSLPKPYPWVTVFYERLTRDGEAEVARIFRGIGEKEIPESISKVLRKPSILTLRDERRVVRNKEDQLSKWRKVLSKKEIERILRIVSDFGLGFYTEDVEPNYNWIDVW
ncbi:MAG TPA: sulfotransferase [Thermoplasmata archaeon]|nr:sulfotransferase [Thermoplasmata archaeon]